MNTILLQAEGGSSWQMPLMLAAIFAVMYFFMIRPQKKKEKELAKKRDAIKKGDEVVTAGGIHGVIHEALETAVVIVIENHGRLKIEKSSIAIINGEGADPKRR
ncbi:MAG: preprotein translocase subunit YajC [Flavobacteriales bacterium]|nr:preprotein translocase subunit YajC [Flavobacteriales bacterium]|tara:strand:+ start:426 stop:737 length:312 start_codon:yes stop_codon:yes gene_type:complete